MCLPRSPGMGCVEGRIRFYKGFTPRLFKEREESSTLQLLKVDNRVWF